MSTRNSYALRLILSSATNDKRKMSNFKENKVLHENSAIKSIYTLGLNTKTHLQGVVTNE